ncbi:MAG: hypothetical protein Fur0010_11430 [Bdellovibrio sp.]
MKNFTIITFNTLLLIIVFFWVPNLFFSKNESQDIDEFPHDENFLYIHLGSDLVKRIPLKSFAGFNDEVGYFNFRNLSTNEVLTHKGRVIYDVHYTMDSDGYRVSLPQKDKNLETVVFLGGSFVFGVGLEDSDTLTSQMSSIDSNRYYLNMGRAGYGPTLILGQVQTEVDHIVKFPPGTLFVYHRYRGGHYQRSWPTISWYKMFKFLIHYRWNKENDTLEKIGPMFGDNKIPLAYFYDFLLTSWVFDSGIFNFDYLFPDEMVAKECRVIKEVAKILKEKSYRFILAEHPLHYEFPNERFENADKVFRECIGNEFPVWTFQDLIIEAQRNKDKYVVDPKHENHPNALMNQLYAQELLKKINSL